MAPILAIFFVGLVVVLVGKFLCACIGVIWALVENIVGAALLGGFIFWCFSTFFTSHAWNDLTIAWWGIILGGIYGLYLTIKENKCLI